MFAGTTEIEISLHFLPLRMHREVDVSGGKGEAGVLVPLAR